MVPGVRFRLGDEVVAEITGYATACDNNAEWFVNREFKRMSQKLHPGWSRTYAKVLEGGTIRPGDAVERLEVSEPAARS